MPSLDAESDSVTNTIASLSSDITYLYYSVQQYLPFLPILLSLSFPQNVPSSIPLFNPLNDISLSFGLLNNSQTYINVQGLSLVQSGFIYLAISANGQGYHPSFDELRLCSNGTFSACVMDFKSAYDEMVWNFTGLNNNTVYYVFYAASEENPGSFANYLDVQVATLNTSYTATSKSRRNHIGIFLMILILITLTVGV